MDSSLLQIQPGNAQIKLNQIGETSQVKQSLRQEYD